MNGNSADYPTMRGTANRRCWNPEADTRVADARIRAEAIDYLATVMAHLQTAPDGDPALVPCMTPAQSAEATFQVLAQREFSYLGKARAWSYWPAMRPLLERDVSKGRPLRFFLDIGGGYHASIDPKQLSPAFEPGLGELLILRQIKRFDDEVRTFYPHGCRFTLVIDNLCALLVNDIPVQRTARYCEKLRSLIDRLELGDRVTVLVESEQFTPDTYETDTVGLVVGEPAPMEVENVSRFLGRVCCAREASERMALYTVVTRSSEAHLHSVIDGVHMTQRATPTSFGFRPFTGGDSRIQAGEVILTRGKRNQIVPKLFTSRSAGYGQLDTLDVTAILPPPLTRVRYSITD